MPAWQQIALTAFGGPAKQQLSPWFLQQIPFSGLQQNCPRGQHFLPHSSCPLEHFLQRPVFGFAQRQFFGQQWSPQKAWFVGQAGWQTRAELGPTRIEVHFSVFLQQSEPHRVVPGGQVREHRPPLQTWPALQHSVPHLVWPFGQWQESATGPGPHEPFPRHVDPPGSHGSQQCGLVRHPLLLLGSAGPVQQIKPCGQQIVKQFAFPGTQICCPVQSRSARALGGRNPASHIPANVVPARRSARRLGIGVASARERSSNQVLRPAPPRPRARGSGRRRQRRRARSRPARR